MSTGSRNWSARVPVLVGVLGIAILVLGFGGWSVSTRIEGAVVAPGTVEVASFRQVVQHQNGGTVTELLIREGDRVEAGSVLMRFDDTALRSESMIIRGELDEILARAARAEAERDGALEVKFLPDQMKRVSTDAELRDLIEGQRRLFAVRRTTLNEQLAQLEERVTQFDNQIAGLEVQLGSVQAQIGFVDLELADQQALLDKGLTQASRVMSLRRERARLDGSIGELESGVAQFSGQIAETRIERLRLESARREEAITNLRDISLWVAELRQRLVAIDDILSRLDIRAPVSGVVYGLQIHTVGAVVRAAEPVLYIVPDTGQLVVQVRIPTVHIDQVHRGQQAILHFSAFDQRTTPVITGIVTKVSPDAFTDEATGAQYYKAEATPDADALQALTHVTLVPGMPVEAFLRTDPRTPLSYILKPLTDYFTRAFRES